MELSALYQKLRFLVVDDFDNFRVTMRNMLLDFGAEHIDVAIHGADAIEKCTYNRFDVVLCDYNMGGGKNGQQILEEVRFKKLLRRTGLFILITAETSKDIVMGARDFQPDGYIAKPITRSVLEKRLGAMLVQREVLLPINREIDKENYPKAISLCDAEYKKGGKYASWCLKTLAELYALTGDYTHAQKVYEDVLTKRSIPWAELGMANVLASQRQYPLAVEHYLKIVEALPDMVEAYDGLASVYQKMGKLGDAQAQLKLAVSRSPLSILRQEKLGDVSLLTQDLESAAQAFKSTVKLGEFSCHASPEHYLKCGDTLSDLCEVGQPEKKHGYAQDAISVLQQCAKRYNSDRPVKTRALLVESRVYQSTGETSLRDLSMTRAQKMLGDAPLEARTGLDLAKTLYRMKNPQEAEKVLMQLAERYESDKVVMSRIESLLEEPLDLANKMQARNLTREGIQAFEEGQLKKAAECFERALDIVPRHPALNLNLVQVLLKLMSETGVDHGLLARCEARLDAVAYLPAQHRQYPRYQHLVKTVKSRKAGAT